MKYLTNNTVKIVNIYDGYELPYNNLYIIKFKT